MSKEEMIEKAARRMYEEDGKNFDPYPYSYTRSTWEQISANYKAQYIRAATIAWDTFAYYVYEMKAVG